MLILKGAVSCRAFIKGVCGCGCFQIKVILVFSQLVVNVITNKAISCRKDEINWVDLLDLLSFDLIQRRFYIWYGN